MKIKTKLTINFTVIVACLLAITSISIYLFSIAHRRSDFFSRLRNKAISTSNLLLNVRVIDANLLKIIDDNTINTLSDIKVWVLDDTKKILYSNTDSASTAQLLPAFSYMRWQDSNFRTQDGNVYLCIVHMYNDKEYFVLASAEDYLGISELKNLRLILLGVFLIGLILTLLAAMLNTHQSLKPIKELIKQVDDIKASNLHKRLETANRDEIAELSRTFNKMLDRIEEAFETERMFVANASHELRTPITSMMGQVEVALLKERTNEEYKTILASSREDLKNLATIVNGFLELAETNLQPESVHFEKIRIDELLFSVKDDIQRQHSQNIVDIDFENIPEDENAIYINGNVRLLKVMFTNLIDNACKFSSNHKALVKIGHEDNLAIIKVIDKGIGIPANDIELIFKPLYRSKNAGDLQGSGIGLSIVRKVANIHNAQIEFESEQNIGTTVTVKLHNCLDASLEAVSIS